MVQYFDILVIDGDWNGGHHGSYPKILSVNPDLESSFSISEGWGHGLGGASFTLKEMVDGGFVEIFNRSESQEIYDILIQANRSSKCGRKLASELLARYGESA